MMDGTIRTIYSRLNDPTELDVKEELGELFLGTDFGRKKGLILVHKKFRRDHFNNREHCSCNNNPLIKEGQEGCPYCNGYGYLWDEKAIEGYLYTKKYPSFAASYSFEKPLGRDFKDQYVFVTETSSEVNEGDIIKEPDRYVDGKLKIPIVIKNEYLITAQRSVGIVNNEKEYTLFVAEVMNKNDYVDNK